MPAADERFVRTPRANAGDVYGRFRAAAVQIAPVFLDREATMAKLERWVAKAKAAGAELVVFGESLLRKYGVIYADPPWSFRNWSAKGTGRNAISHYDCLEMDKLAALPIADLAAADCALFLWAVDPLLHRALEVIRAWGFEYKTVAFYWVKLNAKAKHGADFFTGLGYWTRANPEQCLLATRGKPTRRAKDVRRLVVEGRREHSRKPECVRDRIESLVAGPYVELFARETKAGWDCWGDQAGLFDNGAVTTRRQPSRLVDEAPLLV